MTHSAGAAPGFARPLRVIFAGTPEFARVALAALREAGHNIALVLTQPDRPSGRGLKLQPSAVKQFALDQGIPLAQPRSLRLDGKYPDDAAQARESIQAARADVMVVAAYGLILPQWVLDVPRSGCLNIHASLLPRWRGAAPIHRAVEAGDAQTGITIMQMDAGLDTGNMLLTHALPIHPDDTTGSLHDRLAALGGTLIVQALDLAVTGELQPVKQPEHGVTYAHKVEKSEAEIDWAQPADVIVRRIAAFNPSPGAHTTLNGRGIKVWRAQVSPGNPPPGTKNGLIMAVAPVGIAIAAIQSIAILTELQRAGGKRLAAAEFVRGVDVQPGIRFGDNALSATSPPKLL